MTYPSGMTQEQIDAMAKAQAEQASNQQPSTPDVPTQTTPSTPTTKTPEQIDIEHQEAINRQAQTREAIQKAIDSGSLPADYAKSYEESISSIETKQEMAENIREVEKSYADAGIDIPESVQKQINQQKAIIYGQVSAFTTLKKTPSGIQASTNIPAFLRLNPSQDAENLLADMGIDRSKITQARKYNQRVDEIRSERLQRYNTLKELSPYAVKEDGKIIGYNIDKAILAGDLSLIKKAGFSSIDINNALVRTGKAGTTKQDVTMMAALYPGMSITKPTESKNNMGFADISGYDNLRMGAPGTLSEESFESWLKQIGMTDKIKSEMTTAELSELRTIYDKYKSSTEVPIGQKLIVGRGPGEQVYLPATGEYARKYSLRGFLEGWTSKQEEQQAQFDLMRSPEGMTGILQAPEKIVGLSRASVLVSPVPVIGSTAAYTGRFRTMTGEEKLSGLYDIGFETIWTGATIYALGFKPTKPITTTALPGVTIEKITSKTPTTKLPLRYTQEMPGTRYSFQNPAIWERGSLPTRIYGEIGTSFKTPISSIESFGQRLPMIRYTETGGIYLPEYYIGSSRIPIEPFKPYNIFSKGTLYTITSPPIIKPSGGTQSAIPSTRTMTPEQVARLTGAPVSPIYSPITTLSPGLIIPKPSTKVTPIPDILAIPEEITSPSIKTPTISPAEVTFEEIIGDPEVDFESELIIETEKEKEQKSTTKYEEETQQVTETEHSVTTETIDPTIIDTELIEPYNPIGDSSFKPPPPVPIRMSGTSISSGRGSISTSRKKIFEEYLFKIPKLVVYTPKAPSWMEEDFEDTPFGKRTATVIVGERKLKSGAREASGRSIRRAKAPIRNDSGFNSLVK